ncbi:MAG TPA: MFS transporter [Hyphomicrobiales bacterium]|nr:MFS transporter [Hyphomicrobiales bacterium]
MTATTEDRLRHMNDDARARRNARLLAIGQALGGSGSVIIISSGGIIGHMLAEEKALATLPVTCYILGTALSTLPVNLMMRRLGRRAGYMFGAATGIVAALVAAYAIHVGSFWLFALGTLLVGPYWAQVQSYRFAAADLASDRFVAKAISWVLVGGIASAVIGPQVVIWTKDLFPPFLFLGTFSASAVLAFMALILMSRIDIPRPAPPAPGDGARPLSAIMAQPRFVVSAGCGAVSFASMSLVMTATPLAMVGCGLSADMAALGIQWHVLAMFAPSFITGRLIGRFGKEKIVAAGLVSLSVSAVIAISGLSVWHFWAALVFLGLGWNFGFIGATAMLTDCYLPVERNKVQGMNDFLVFGLNAVASFSSGVLLNLAGWTAVNLIVFPPVILCIAALLWLAGTRNRALLPE